MLIPATGQFAHYFDLSTESSQRALSAPVNTPCLAVENAIIGSYPVGYPSHSISDWLVLDQSTMPVHDVRERVLPETMMTHEREFRIAHGQYDLRFEKWRKQSLCYTHGVWLTYKNQLE